jgi:hypothetical protein
MDNYMKETTKTYSMILDQFVYPIGHSPLYYVDSQIGPSLAKLAQLVSLLCMTILSLQSQANEMKFVLLFQCH